jgi:hypothetical protein
VKTVAMSCAGNLPDHNKDLTVQGIHQGSNLVLPVVCADNWNNAVKKKKKTDLLKKLW